MRLIDDWDGFGQRRAGTGTTVFTDVAVSRDEVLTDTAYDADPVDDGVVLLGSRDRSFSHALSERPTDDPLYQKQLGGLAATAYIAKAAVLDAAEATTPTSE